MSFRHTSSSLVHITAVDLGDLSFVLAAPGPRGLWRQQRQLVERSSRPRTSRSVSTGRCIPACTPRRYIRLGDASVEGPATEGKGGGGDSDFGGPADRWSSAGTSRSRAESMRLQIRVPSTIETNRRPARRDYCGTLEM